MRPLYFILIMNMLFFSCKKDHVKAGRTVEIYLLKITKLWLENAR